MERLLWREYKPGDISPKIEYWVDIWDDLIEHFTQDHYGLELQNPHVLVLVSIDEIEFNEMRNAEVKRYLIQGFASALKNDRAVQDLMRTEFALILQAFSQQPLFYLLQACKGALLLFSSGSYFREAFEVLRSILARRDWQPEDAEQIEALSNSLIVELVLKGYSLKTIAKMPRNLFSKAEAGQSSFPSLAGEVARDETETDWEQLKKATQAELDALTVDLRLSAFLRYFDRKPQKRLFIFEVEGFKGSAKLQVGPVTIYSSNSQRTAGSPEARKFENDFFPRKEPELLRASVEFETVDDDSGVLQAAELAEKALDLIASEFSPGTTLAISREHVLIIDANTRLIGAQSAMSRDHPAKRLLDAMNLERCITHPPSIELIRNTAEYLFKTRELQSSIEQKIVDGLHWMRKARETERLEDRLLGYWIVLEKSFTFPISSPPLLKGGAELERKIFLISELVPAIIAYSLVYTWGWTLYHYVRTLVNRWQGIPGHGLANLTLPNDIAKACALSPSHEGTVFLKDILPQLEALENAVDKPLVKSRISRTRRFYSDGEFAKEQIEKAIKRTREEIFSIYRIRNSIVHNAHYNSTLLPALVEKAGSLAEAVLNQLIHARSSNAGVSAEQVFVDKHVALQNILNRFAKNEKVHFTELTEWNSKSASPITPPTPAQAATAKGQAN